MDIQWQSRISNIYVTFRTQPTPPVILIFAASAMRGQQHSIRADPALCFVEAGQSQIKKYAIRQSD
jgi:hypothetical protein